MIPDPRLARAASLKSAIDRHNQHVGVQKVLYDQHVAKLAELGLTPETVDQEIQNLTGQLNQLGESLDREMDEVEALLK